MLNPHASSVASQPGRRLDVRMLLALYVLLPFSVFLVIFDQLIWHQLLQQRILPANPEQWPYWSLVFGLPHIVASLITLADREYLIYYRRRLAAPLFWISVFVASGILGPQPASSLILYSVLAIYTIYHVLAQQLGLSAMLMGRKPNQLFRWWKWIAIFSGVAIYIDLYGSPYFHSVESSRGYGSLILPGMALILCVAQLAISFRLVMDCKSALARWYLMANSLMLMLLFVFNTLGYSILVILIPRVIHDLTAYFVYVTHDINRNRSVAKNYFYRLPFFRIAPLLVVLPVASLSIAYLLSISQDYELIGALILVLYFLHYYCEGIIWRGGSPHRRSMEFKL